MAGGPVVDDDDDKKDEPIRALDAGDIALLKPSIRPFLFLPLRRALFARARVIDICASTSPRCVVQVRKGTGRSGGRGGSYGTAYPVARPQKFQ